MSVATKTNPQKWKAIVASVKAGSKGGDPGEWSARKSQLATKRYKESGGGYSGPKKSDNSLKRWSDQKWTTSDGSKSEGKKRYLPEKAWKSLTPAEKAATNRAKAAGDAKGKQFVAQPEKVAKKTAKFRK